MEEEDTRMRSFISFDLLSKHKIEEALEDRIQW